MKDTPDIKTIFLMGLGGLIFILVSTSLPDEDYKELIPVIKVVGTGLLGFFSVQLSMNLLSWVGEARNKNRVKNIFKSQVKLKSNSDFDGLPILIATDVEGCITPPNRAAIDLPKLQRLRSYVEFTRVNSQFPRIVIFTGRSQGYVELLAQTMGLLSFDTDVPCVIENGAALYFPGSKKTHTLLTNKQIKQIREIEFKLMNHFGKNTFEPKSYMITINPLDAENVEDLRQKIALYLHEEGLDSSLNITNTASAVDITPSGIDKSTGLTAVLKYLYPDETNVEHLLQRIVGIGDHISDLPVLKRVGRPYCPAQNVHSEVRAYVEESTSNNNVIDKPHIDFVTEVLARECGLIVL